MQERLISEKKDMANQERLEIEKEENMKRMKENMTKVTKKVQVFSDP